MWPLESKLDGSTSVIPLPCLSGTCVLHNVLKQLRGYTEGNKTTQKPEKELTDQVNLSWLLHSNDMVALQCKDLADSRRRVLPPGITDQMPPVRVGSGSPVLEDQGVQRDGGVTAGYREVTDTWARGDTGGWPGAGRGRWGGGDHLPQGLGNSRTWPQAPKLSRGLSSPSKGGQEVVWMLAAPARPPWSPRQCHRGLPSSPRLTTG